MKLAIAMLITAALAACGDLSSNSTAGAPMFPTAVPVAAGQPMTNASLNWAPKIGDPGYSTPLR